MRQRLRDTAVGLTALAALAGWLVGVPLLLWTWRHNPLPTAIPAWDRLTTLIDAGHLDPGLIPNTVAVIAWAAWAWVTRTILLDTSARLHHRPAPTAGPGRLQVAVGRWVSAATLVAVLFTQRPTPAPAGGPPPLHSHASAHTVRLDAEAAPSAVMTRTSPSPPPAPAAATAPVAVYVVQRGDSYWRIAEQHRGSGARWRELRDANIGNHRIDGTVITADSKLIHPGDHLHLPPSWTTTTTPPAAPSPASTAVHVVEPGENLSDIAADELGDPNDWPEIYDLNRDQIRDPNLIYTGQHLRLPPSEPPVPPVGGSAPETVTTPQLPLPAAPSEAAPPTAPEAEAATSPDPALPVTSPPASTAPPLDIGSGATRADQPSESNAPTAALAATLGAVTAGAVVWQLRRRRAFALLRRRPHHRLPTPSASARHVESLLVNLADTDTVDWLDATQRALRAQLAGTNHPGRIIALRAGAHGVEILWTEPPPIIPPWVADHTGTWRLRAGVTLDDLRLLGHDHGPIAPATVTLGDTIDGPLLVDLETAGTLLIDAPPEQARDVLAALTVELATSPWAANLDLRVIAGPAELTALDRIQATTADAIGSLAARAAATPPDDDTPYRSRLADPEDDRAPTVVVAFGPIDLRRLSAHLGPGNPAGIVALITTAAVGVPHTGLVLTVSDDGSGRLTPPGLDLTRVNSADPATRTAVVELVTEPAPELKDGGATAPTPNDATAGADARLRTASDPHGPVEVDIGQILHARPIEVRILTATPTVTGWHTPPTGHIATELVAFFATRTRPIPPATARSILYPDGITSEAWRAALSRTRRSLGTDPTTGVDHLPAADTGRLALGDGVGCDWTRFQALRHTAAHCQAGDRARLLSAALTLIDGEPFSAIAPRRYRWVDDPHDYLRQQITVAIHDTATDLAELALSELEDPSLALEAVRAGLLGGGDNEHLHRLAVRAHLAHGNPTAADAVIRHLERTIHSYDGLSDLQPETLELITHWTSPTTEEVEAASARGVA